MPIKYVHQQHTHNYGMSTKIQENLSISENQRKLNDLYRGK